MMKQLCCKSFFIILVFFLPKHLAAQYISSSATHVVNNNLWPNSNNQEILRIDIEIGPQPVLLTNVEFTTNGSSAPTFDFNIAKFWHSTDSINFNTANASMLGFYNWVGINFEFLLTTPNPFYFGLSSFNGMVPGMNHFWLTYDIRPGATACNFVDATFEKFTIDGLVTIPQLSIIPGYSIIQPCATGMNIEMALAPLIVYPSPCHDEITLRFTHEPQESVSVELFSVSGKRLDIRITNKDEFINNNEIKLPANKIPNGIYVIKTVYDNSVFYNKIVKQ